MSPKLTKASRKRIQSQNAAYARETKRARLGDSAAVPALPEHVERYLDLIRRPANEQRDDADISPSLYIVEDDEYVDEDDEYEPGADQSDSSSEDQSNSPSEDSVTPQRRTGGARPSDGHGSSLGSSRRDRPARAERRDEPCLGCTNSALAGRSTGECFNTVGNGSRCWRCASGHSCYALPKDVVRWAKSLVVARIADNREVRFLPALCSR
ncbi:hypothetical protein F4781DRAFT_146192 [Annulohypoxylon bovei var. microspora]|nr:hypothetical protein F4781DRAFT_146192 [Annulohypoxylon bovei var. microspora]